MPAILTLVLLGSVLAGCSSSDKSGRFSTALGKMLQNEHADRIDLAEVEGPAWDELYIFRAGSTREANCTTLRLSWLDCRTTLPATVAVDEDFIVFLIKGRVSSAQRHSLRNGNFVIAPGEALGPVRRAAAKFGVAKDVARAESSTPTYLLALQP
jgi:hypothetical protein